jgi:hypothetical protein
MMRRKFSVLGCQPRFLAFTLLCVITAVLALSNATYPTMAFEYDENSCTRRMAAGRSFGFAGS